MKGTLHYYDEDGIQWEFFNRGVRWMAQPMSGPPTMGIMVTAFIDGPGKLIQLVDEREKG